MFSLQCDLHVHTSMYLIVTVNIKLTDIRHSSSCKTVQSVASIHEIFKFKWTHRWFYKSQYFLVCFEFYALFTSWVLGWKPFDVQVTIKLLIIKMMEDIWDVWRTPLKLCSDFQYQRQSLSKKLKSAFILKVP